MWRICLGHSRQGHQQQETKQYSQVDSQPVADSTTHRLFLGLYWLGLGGLRLLAREIGDDDVADIRRDQDAKHRGGFWILMLARWGAKTSLSLYGGKMERLDGWKMVSPHAMICFELFRHFKSSLSLRSFFRLGPDTSVVVSAFMKAFLYVLS
jgi:hypothetical protein